MHTYWQSEKSSLWSDLIYYTILELTSFQVTGVSYSDEMDERLDRGVGNRGREGIGGGLGGGDSWGSDLHDDPVWCLS